MTTPASKTLTINGHTITAAGLGQGYEWIHCTICRDDSGPLVHWDTINGWHTLGDRDIVPLAHGPAVGVILRHCGWTETEAQAEVFIAALAHQDATTMPTQALLASLQGVAKPRR